MYIVELQFFFFFFGGGGGGGAGGISGAFRQYFSLYRAVSNLFSSHLETTP